MHGYGGRSGGIADGETRRRVDELIRLRMAGDIEALLAFFTEDVELCYNCSKVGAFPAGLWRGKAALRESLRRANVDYEPLEGEVQDVFVDGDRTAVRWTGAFRRRANGRVYRKDMAHFLRWRMDRIESLDEFVDDHAVARATGPRPRSFEEMIAPPGAGLSRDEMLRRVTDLCSFSHAGPDIALFRRYCAPDVISEFVGDRATIFYAGRHRGLDALTRIIRAIDIDFEQVGATTPRMVADASGVAARRTVEWRHRGTGRLGVVALADFVRFENGKIVELVEFRDNVALLQMQG